MKPIRNELYVLMNEQGLYVSGYVKRYALLPHNRLRYSKHPSDALLFPDTDSIDGWLRERYDLIEANIPLSPKKFVLVEVQ